MVFVTVLECVVLLQRGNSIQLLICILRALILVYRGFSVREKTGMYLSLFHPHIPHAFLKPQHKTTCGPTVKGSGILKLVNNFCANKLLLFHLQMCLIIDLDLLRNCSVDTPLMACLDISIFMQLLSDVAGEEGDMEDARPSSERLL